MSQTENKHLSQTESWRWVDSQVCRISFVLMKKGDWRFVLTSVVSQLQRSGDDIGTLWESFKLISFYPKYMASKPSKNRASGTITKKACSVQEGMVPSGPWHPPRGNIYQCFLSCC